MKILNILLLGVTILSCSKITEREYTYPPTDTTIKLEDALDNLSKMISDIYGETKALERDLNVDVFGGVSTKSGNISLPDSTLYLVNFIDDGFAVLSATTLLNTPVFCISSRAVYPYKIWKMH